MPTVGVSIARARRLAFGQKYPGLVTKRIAEYYADVGLPYFVWSFCNLRIDRRKLYWGCSLSFSSIVDVDTLFLFGGI